MRFNVTYKIITPESAEQGDCAESGFIAESVTLREAIDLVFATRTSHCYGTICVETNEYPMTAPRWITVYNGGEYLTGAYENRSIHFPPGVTPASRRRLARLMGAV
jgi:hypothetical protein